MKIVNNHNLNIRNNNKNIITIKFIVDLLNNFFYKKNKTYLKIIRNTDFKDLPVRNISSINRVFKQCIYKLVQVR